MQKFSFQNTQITGLTLITPFCAPDGRGYLSKPFEKSIFEANGINLSPWEELRSFSHKGVLRGLHFQRRHSQDKLVQVLHGAVYDVAVDLRKGSETFGQWEGFYLSAENLNLLYIPKLLENGLGLSYPQKTKSSFLFPRALPTVFWRWRRARCSVTCAETGMTRNQTGVFDGMIQRWLLSGRWIK